MLTRRAGGVAAGVLGMLTGSHRVHFFTTQSNLIVLGYYAGVLYWMVRRRTVDPAAPRLRGAVTLWIMITCLVSHFVTNDGENPLPGLVHGDPETLLAHRSIFLLHYVVPLMALFDWVAFGPHRVVPWRDLPLWLLFPLGYGVTSVLRAVWFPTVPNRYPYFFLDPSEHGYGWVLLWQAVLGAGFLVLGAALLGLDRLASPRGAPTAPVPEEEPVRISGG
ncbi:Pr6Pr family membrane protein [Nonomuraea sp. NPDC050643]|uniref:Pr6Pr family membrane protein n=1 Tax=Nonomuraea sp. NPDC050643 TaxID=3155660 RepID=UPI0033FBDEBE